VKIEKISYYSLSKIERGFDKRKTNCYLMICRKCKNAKIVEQYKLSLFRSMGVIIIKNINNFFYFIRNFDKPCIYTKEDLINECYIIFERCIQSSFNTKSGKDFFWYFNTSLTRGLKRIMDESYLRNLKIENHKNFLNLKITEESRADFLGYYSKILNLTEKEEKVFLSKIEQIKIKDFIKDNSINENEYYRLFNSIKEKINKIKHELVN
jgi:hypothetical protein